MELMSEGPEDNELENIFREQPLQSDYGSEGDSFQGSLDGEDGLALESEPDLPRRSGFRRTTKSTRNPVQPTTYVLDRGLDLPPGVPRPNRWDGPPSTYRQLISDERGAYEAILANRSRDLAAHLYDSFVLRKQKAEASLGPEDESEDPAAVKKVWVGWPMLADNVPRSDEYIRRQFDDPDTYRRAPDPRPSADIEEAIITNLLQTAKGMFMEREWDLEQLRALRVRSQGGQSSKLDTDVRRSKREASEPADPNHEPLYPVLQADDDKSRRQLRPLSREILAQMDRVLTGLHHAMQGRTRVRDSGEESKSDTGSETSRSRSRSRGRRRATKKSSRASRAQNRSRSRLAADGNEEMDDTPKPRGRKRKPDRYIFHRGEQRDWSEVMGIASMIGLPQDVVMKASKRCADLFGQDMEFRRFHEGRMCKMKRLPSGKWRRAYIESETEDENEKDPASAPKPRRRGQAEQLPHYNSDGEPTLPRLALRYKGKGAHRKFDILCPITTCPRHTDGFSRTWNLTQHLRKAHGRERAQSVPAPAQKPDVIQID